MVAAPAPSEPVPWRDWTVGSRVMVRRHIDDPQHKFTDVLGVIVTTDADGLVLDTRKGEVFVPGEMIFQGKPIPPPPARRRPKHQD